MNKVVRTLGSPVRDYFSPRFDHISKTLTDMQASLDQLTGKVPTPKAEGALTPRQSAELLQRELLAIIDVSEHNTSGSFPTFDVLRCQAASAVQCDHPDHLQWCQLIENWEGAPEGRQYNRKLWEWAYIAEAVKRAGLMRPGARAIGFGAGTEPMPALFAKNGLDVLATDQGVDVGAEWDTNGELMHDLSGFSRPHIVSDGELAQRVKIREVDMNDIPHDIGLFDVAWSSCVIEHLGSPQRGMDFVLESCGLLNPGGIAVHTTELELTARSETADYGHCAVYRISDLVALGERLADVGCSAEFTFAVSMDTFQDRWISLAHMGRRDDLPDEAHLKLALGDSITTSYGLLILKDI